LSYPGRRVVVDAARQCNTPGDGPRPDGAWQNGPMRFRIGLLVGAGIGYVAGTRAGRERYEQLKRAGAKARQHPAVAQLNEQAGAVVDLARNTVARGLEEGSKGMRRMADRPTGS
jgi:hypothetical protein